MSKTALHADDLTGLRVLVVDDEADIRLGLRKLVSTLGASVASAADGAEALELIEREGADLVLTDLMMPRKSGAELLADVKERFPSTIVVVLTGYGTIQGAVSCLQQGAAHFMTKPFDNQDVLTLVARLGRQALAARDAARSNGGGPEIVAEDPAMQRIMQLVDRVASNPVPVLIEGESGTGKEVVARAIHERSTMRSRPFLAVNAAALPDGLLESELFGHTRGSFTGAEKDREGIFQQAGGGSVFLDELSSMSLPFQGKLLRVLQEKVVRPLGGNRDVEVDFRLIAATNRDLEKLSRSGEFREDLFYRVSVMRMHLPPLRKRPGDIVPLALLFLKRAVETCLGSEATPPELAASTLDALQRHSWPGNVRELENAMVRAVVVCPGDRVLPHHLGLSSSTWKAEEDPSELDYAEGKRRAIEGYQREFVQRALERTGGNVSQAAGRCGMTRAALQRILRQLEIDAASFRGA
jgi:DNA-binding NtrC family response regulator